MSTSTVDKTAVLQDLFEQCVRDKNDTDAAVMARAFLSGVCGMFGPYDAVDTPSTLRTRAGYATGLYGQLTDDLSRTRELLWCTILEGWLTQDIDEHGERSLQIFLVGADLGKGETQKKLLSRLREKLDRADKSVALQRVMNFLCFAEPGDSMVFREIGRMLGRYVSNPGHVALLAQVLQTIHKQKIPSDMPRIVGSMIRRDIAKDMKSWRNCADEVYALHPCFAPGEMIDMQLRDIEGLYIEVAGAKKGKELEMAERIGSAIDAARKDAPTLQDLNVYVLCLNNPKIRGNGSYSRNGPLKKV